MERKASRDRDELNEALAQHRGEYETWKAGMVAELQKAQAKKDEVDAEESEIERSLRRAHDEMSQQAQTLREEVNEKTTELEELDAGILDFHQRLLRLEDDRPARDETERASFSRAEQLRRQGQEEQVAVSTLHQDIIAIRAHLEDLRKSEQEAQARLSKDKGKPKEDLRSLEKQKAEYERDIEKERQRQEDLREQLEMAESRAGLFSCFFPKSNPKAKAKPRTGGAASQGGGGGASASAKPRESDSEWC